MSHFYGEYKNLSIKLITLLFCHKIFLKIVPKSILLKRFFNMSYILLILHVPT